MVNRLIRLSRSNSFFILGPRGVGKSTLIRNCYNLQKESFLYIDLLNPNIEDQYRLNPNVLKQQVSAHSRLRWVVIDEVQKLPRLLDIVHELIENTSLKFILSGSSARKLKRGGSNLLAGRAFMFYLYPFTSIELKEKFNLKKSLQWGMLPQIFKFKSNQDRKEYLKSYTLTYLREEIQIEQIVRKLTPFRKFLEIAAQMNGKIINFSKIGSDIGVDTTTVQNYYSILEDTLIGFHLQAYHTSIRKSQRLSPKFYLFDTGVCRALKRTLDLPLLPQTYDFGEAFEHFIILEFIKLSEYYRKDWKFFYLRTKDGAEIDLIVERPGQKTICIEIKSSDRITQHDVKVLNTLGQSIPNSILYCLSRDVQKKKIQNTYCLEWQEGLKKIFR
ncbi:MAG: AAA family ATPase [Bdellovibrionales bacterium]|nr:AAA family ATPase [Bdellovibrionales bacterium]